ncbi:TetR family transcriptional regulator [Paractinoplanes ferrugineus]|uniref:TetR family transcriptional regulator n=2 Tax=Paractinoplanes ferrugineus TaxID=113564 RepID=A0A919J6X0_9ACTN|nr:TetR family transcriptional regulator [Actinoplanes ferrugineus]
MSPDQRREMIVAAAVPLLMEHGAAVSTHQIAKAAGIGEATVFRAFADKDELLSACVAAVLRNDRVLAELDDVPLDQPLDARLNEAAGTLRAYLDRMGAVIGAVHAAGGRRLERRASPEAEPHAPDGGAPARDGGAGHAADGGAAHAPARGGERGERGGAVPGGRDEAVARTRAAVVRLLEPDRDKLRLPVEQVATIFLGMLFPRHGTGAADADVSIEMLVDVFLHGAATEAG